MIFAIGTPIARGCMGIVCDLYKQWIRRIRYELTNAGYDASGMLERDCAVLWQSWKRREVSTRARSIQRARGFSCPQHLQPTLANLEDAFKNGNAVWPWQSKLIDKPTYEDGLFNDYRVVHFHLGTKIDQKGFVSRTNELLFAIVDDLNVYEIGIYNHGDWYELDMLEVIDENWSRLLERVTIQGLDISGGPQTREDVRVLRQNNVNSMIKLKSGRIVASLGGGVSADGTSIEAIRHADYWGRLIRNGEELIANDIKERIRDGVMADGEYKVELEVADKEIAGVVLGVAKWVLWKAG